MRYIFVMLLLLACSTTANHGVILKERDISAIKINLTRAEDVRTILGEPSFIWKAKWYYISSVTKQRAFFNPKLKNTKPMPYHSKTVLFRKLNISQRKIFNILKLKSKN